MPAELARKGLFITGTDTGVGKTLVTAALAMILGDRGVKTGVMKPVETGVTHPEGLGDDAALLVAAAGTQQDAELVSPYRFPLPASPDLAAQKAGAAIHPAQILDAEKQLAGRHDFMLIEGAGGLMVPLRGGYLIADLARDLGYPLLVVSCPSLGTINHTLLTVHAARTMDLEVAGIVVNRMPAQPSPSEDAAPHALASLASTDLLAVLPEVSGEPAKKAALLAEALTASPTFGWLLSAMGCEPTR